MEYKFRKEVLPKLLQPIEQFLLENHVLLARLRVDDGTAQSSRINADRLRSSVSSVWSKEINAGVVEWLDAIGEVVVDYRYEAWVVRSLWFVMNPSAESAERRGVLTVEFVLPPYLHYIEKEAREANLESEQDAVAFATKATDEQRTRMFEVSKTMLASGHSKDVYAFLKENPIVRFQSSRQIYWYLGAMDFAGANFD